MTTRLTPNFTLEEFSVSASHPGLTEPVPAKYEGNALRLATELQEIRDDWQNPLKILSAYRPDALNKAVGGSGTSQHRYCEAADVTTVGARDLFRELRANATGLKLGQIIWYPNQNFIHLALPSTRYARPTFFVSPGGKRYIRVDTDVGIALAERGG